ncbi:MAG: xanthine dehydrogenase family protein molybdopterin-binding subunit [Saprospiraceae bacterium]|nr:xanthine dehydrogenase family protein molybdopterin-binding subunit [Saprospiraceae bacterium]
MKTTYNIYKLNRRHFVKMTGIAGLGGLLLGVQFSCKDKAQTLAGIPEAVFSPNVYISIAGTGIVTLFAHRSEMGTGIRTSLPLVMADELEADWTKVKLVQAEGDKKYGDQNTDGSFSMRMFYIPLRKTAATVRRILELTAAKEWGVDVSECTAKNHKIVHTSGKVLGYGFLADKAGAIPIPKEEEIKLKSDQDFKYIGKKSSIYDLEDIVTGKAVFGMDVAIPNAKIAVIKRNPEPGAGWKSANLDKAQASEGVIKVFTIQNNPFPMGHQKPLGGIVVVAKNTWAAIKGRESVEVQWLKSANANYNTVTFGQEMLAKVNKKGKVVRSAGDVDTAIKSATKVIKTDFQTSHVSHTPMETPCAVAHAKTDGTIEVWAPVQDPQWTRRAVAETLGIGEEKVIVNVTLLGGAFGRKSKPDFVAEAALISKEIGEPVKLLWTREDDIQHDYYHYNSAQHIEASLDSNNKLTGWLHRSAFPPIGGTGDIKEKQASGAEMCMGLIDNPIAVPNVSIEIHEVPAKIRIGWLRSVANIHHAFAISSMLDQVAHQRHVDPAQNLLDLLGDDRSIDFKSLSTDFWNYNEKLEDFPWETARLRKVIELVKEKSGWGKTMVSGSGMGISAHRSFLTYVACVVTVQVSSDGKIKIPMVHYAVDCGRVVNPDRVKSQFEGGAAFAASFALKSEISVKNGQVEQSNFDNYHLARITDAPIETEVHLIDSIEKPTGVGEPPVPPFIPALCNAIFMATGKRVTKLPIDLKSIISAI